MCTARNYPRRHVGQIRSYIRAFITTQLYDLAPVFRAVVTLALPPEQAAARLGDHAGELDRVDDTSCRWHSPEDTIDWLTVRLTLLGCDFTVHELVELRSRRGHRRWGLRRELGWVSVAATAV